MGAIGNFGIYFLLFQYYESSTNYLIFNLSTLNKIQILKVLTFIPNKIYSKLRGTDLTVGALHYIYLVEQRGEGGAWEN